MATCRKYYQKHIVLEVARQLSCGEKGILSGNYNKSVFTGAIPLSVNSKEQNVVSYLSMNSINQKIYHLLLTKIQIKRLATIG